MNETLAFSFGLESILPEYLLVFALLVVLYMAIGSYVWLVYRLCRVMKVGAPIDHRPLKERQVITEMGGGIATCMIVAAYFYCSLYFIDDLYPDRFEIGLLQASGFMLVYDFYFYVTHRLLHETRLSRFHLRHHKSISASPWACINLHPVEALIIFLPYLIFAVMVPISLAVLVGVYAYLLFGSAAFGHANYNLFAKTERFPFLQKIICFHQYHHSSGSANYGFLYTHWDSVFGTKHLGPNYPGTPTSGHDILEPHL